MKKGYLIYIKQKEKKVKIVVTRGLKPRLGNTLSVVFDPGFAPFARYLILTMRSSSTLAPRGREFTPMAHLA